MIDPAAITNFNRNGSELEELALFAVAVAGKNAGQTAVKTAQFIESLPGNGPFHKILTAGYDGMVMAMMRRKIGQYRRIGKAWWALANAYVLLPEAKVADLEAIPGIGPKTARFFILHSRHGADVAVLDTHVLAHIRDLGYAAPKATPQNPAKYAELEAIVLGLAKAAGMTPAEYDLAVWLSRRKTFKVPGNSKTI